MSDCFDHEGDAWASLDDDRDDDWNYGYRSHRFTNWTPRTVRCRKCGAVCTWRFSMDAWRLAEGAKLHDCSAVQPGEFEDLTKCSSSLPS